MHYSVAHLLGPWNIFQHAQQNIPKYIFKQVNHFIHILRPRARVKFYGSFNHFHNPHFQVHRQDLSSSSPYEQPLEQTQENYQVYTLKDNLSYPPDL